MVPAPVSLSERMIDFSIHVPLEAGPLEAFLGRDLLCVLKDEKTVRALTPDLERVKQIDGLLLHVTAAGMDTDCVSRSFAPKLEITEDPGCGSGHCHIIPYWAEMLGKLRSTDGRRKFKDAGNKIEKSHVRQGSDRSRKDESYWLVHNNYFEI